MRKEIKKFGFRQVGVGLSCLMALLALTLPFSADAGPGDPDATFDGDGIVFADFLSRNDFATDAVIQADGLILVVGYTGSSADFALARFNEDGSLDATFGTGGRVTQSFGPARDDRIWGVALQEDGKIVVVGYTGSANSEFAIARYNSDGSLDSSFGTGGLVTTALTTAADSAEVVEIQSDGKIVVAGVANNDFAVVRYNSDGSLDSGFGSGGIVITDTGTGERALDLALQSDGKIVIAGWKIMSLNNQDIAVLRYNEDGTPDTTFDEDGMVTTEVTKSNDQGFALAIQKDGKILVAGAGGTNPASAADIALVRYNSDGSLDLSFDGDGMVTTPIGSSYDAASSLLIESDGEIWVSATTNGGSGSGNDFGLLKYNSDGSLDSSFNDDGIVTTAVGTGVDTTAAVLLDSLGKILIAGYSLQGTTYDFALARYSGDAASVITELVSVSSVSSTSTGSGKSLAGSGSSSGASSPVTLEVVSAVKGGASAGDKSKEASSEPKPVVSVSDAAGKEGGSVIFTLTLSETAEIPVSLDYEVIDGSATGGDDYMVASGAVTFDPGMTEATIEVVTSSDEDDEPPQNFVVSFTNPVGVTLASSTVNGTIVDDDNPVVDETEECTITAVNLITGRTCGQATAMEGEDFSISCDPALATDPQDSTKVRISLIANCGALTFEKYQQATIANTSEMNAGEIDEDDTFAAQLLEGELDELGFDAIRDETFRPQCFASFLGELFQDASGEEDGVSRALGTFKAVLRCLMSRDIPPWEVGFDTYPEIISAMRSGELDSYELELLAVTADAACGLDAATLETRLTEARGILENLADLVRERIAGDEENCDGIERNRERQAWVETIQSLDSGLFYNEDSVGRVALLVEDFIEEAREEGDYTALIQSSEIVAGAITTVIEEGLESALEADEFDTLFDTLASLSFEDGLPLDPAQLGGTLVSLIAEADDETIADLQDPTSAALFGNYLANLLEDGTLTDGESDLLARGAGDVWRFLEENERTLEGCEDREGPFDWDCFENLPQPGDSAPGGALTSGANVPGAPGEGDEEEGE